MAKRLFDVLVAVLALAALAPVLLAAACWVRWDSPGPAVFRQERVGRHGKIFRIHKLRTMRVGAATQGPAVTTLADARVTRAGRWLRHYRIDELPQLLDVIAGRMSLVGPRPELPRFVALYPPALREQVLSVRPGITDPASLEFVDEAANAHGGRRCRAALHRTHPAAQAAPPGRVRAVREPGVGPGGARTHTACGVRS